MLGERFSQTPLLGEGSHWFQLVPVPRELDGQLPSAVYPPVEFPPTLECLLVAGNENLPSGAPNTWNESKSLRLLHFYGEDEDTDTEDDNNDRSRTRRLRLARKIGVTQPQLNFAMLSL